MFISVVSIEHSICHTAEAKSVSAVLRNSPNIVDYCNGSHPKHEHTNRHLFSLLLQICWYNASFLKVNSSGICRAEAHSDTAAPVKRLLSNTDARRRRLSNAHSHYTPAFIKPRLDFHQVKALGICPAEVFVGTAACVKESPSHTDVQPTPDGMMYTTDLRQNCSELAASRTSPVVSLAHANRINRREGDNCCPTVTNSQQIHCTKTTTERPTQYVNNNTERPSTVMTVTDRYQTLHTEFLDHTVATSTSHCNSHAVVIFQMGQWT